MVDDDDSVRRTDPLLANPIVATGHTGEMERPGDDRSPWVIGILLAAFASLISGLVTVALTRDDGSSEASGEPSAEVPAVVSPSDTGEIDGGAGAGDPPATAETEEIEGDPIADDGDETPPTGEPDAAAPTTLDELSLDGRRLPAPGFADVDGAVVPIVASCENHLPLAPADNDTQLSSYFLRTPSGDPLIVDRRFGVDGDLVSVGDVVATGLVVDTDDGRGAFVAEVGAPVDATLVVNPDPGGGVACGDTLVTNEPGRQAFPHTRIVLASCARGTLGSDLVAAGLSTEGASFSVRGNGDGTVALVYAESADAPDLIDPAASAFESDGRLGFSGTVGDGDAARDLAVDITPDRDDSCSTPDRL